MKQEQLSKAFGNIDERFIVEAFRPVPGDASSTSERILHMKKKRIFSIALAACLVIALGASAYATNFFGLVNLSVDGKYGPTVIVNAGSSLTAAEEWRTYIAENADSNMPTPNTPIDIYGHYGAFTQEAKDKLNSIVQRHGLKLFTEKSKCGSVEQLYMLLHTDAFLPAGSGNGHGTVFDSKSVYSFVTDATVRNGKIIHYDLYLLQDGYFMNPAAMTTDASYYEETSYSIPGAEITLALGSDRSYILAYSDDYSLTVYIRAGSENKNEALSSYNFDTVTMDDLKIFADSINFDAIANIYN